MSSHSYELTNQATRPASHMPARAESITATLAVRPPFEVPEARTLSRIVLGSDSWDMQIAHTTNTEDDASYFAVSAAEGSEQANQATLQRLGERVVRYADDPSQAVVMMRESPFAFNER